jgi:DNA polymerase-4
MNKQLLPEPNDRVAWLFLDLNSYFASCEQQARPELRGKPVAIVQMMTDSTCAIAASYEAKAFGVKTGTPIWEARQKCPGLVVVQARHKMYVEYHHRIFAAVETCVPIEKVCSIDEVACRLAGPQRDPAVAQELARRVKQAVRTMVGERMTCSIGLAPNLFLGKVGSDMQKPDGLVTITKRDLPHALHRLDLTDIYGIGARMEQRLRMAGIGSVEQLIAAPRHILRQAWGGIYGVLYYELLHGADLQFPSSTQSHSISHQHVLEPALRSVDGARQFSQHLLAKAAERLRHKNYFCSRLGVFATGKLPSGGYERWWQETGFHETQDTGFLLSRLETLWRRPPGFAPKKIGVVLMGLVPATAHQADLFANDGAAGKGVEKGAEKGNGKQRQNLSPVIDRINQRYGRGAIGFGRLPDDIRAFTGHAAFQRIPEIFEF